MNNDFEALKDITLSQALTNLLLFIKKTIDIELRLCIKSMQLVCSLLNNNCLPTSYSYTAGARAHAHRYVPVARRKGVLVWIQTAIQQPSYDRDDYVCVRKV